VATEYSFACFRVFLFYIFDLKILKNSKTIKLKQMKKIALLLAILISTSLSAQIKVKINDKLITEATVIKGEQIKKMDIAFDKPKKISYYGLGLVVLMVELIQENGGSQYQYSILKEGTNAIESFLQDVNTYYPFPSETVKATEFSSTFPITSALTWLGKNYTDAKTVKLKISLYFKDKIGYEKYGDAVYLIKPQFYTIDNTVLFAEGQRLKAEEKAAEDAKRAEDEKKAEEAKKQKEAEDKKNKGKKILKNVLGW
jgi:hypothetical protein